MSPAILAQYLLPHKTLSHVVRAATRWSWRPWKDFLIGRVVKAYRVDMTEAAQPDPFAYPDFNAFFTRALREGARHAAGGGDTILCPADGRISQVGPVEDGRILQAKGRTFSVAELLADPEAAGKYRDGAFATIYLSPRDYHRVHTPVDGRLVRYDYIPGALWPVNPVVAARRDRLLVRNERVVITIDAGRLGRVAIVMVGAAGVGNIALEYAPESVTWRAQGERRRIELDHELARGDELGAFRLGSTVVMVFEPKAVTLSGEVGQMMRFGERMGAFSYGGRA